MRSDGTLPATFGALNPRKRRIPLPKSLFPHLKSRTPTSGLHITQRHRWSFPMSSAQPFVITVGQLRPSFTMAVTRPPRGSAGSCVGPRQLTRQTVSGWIPSGAPDDEPDRPAPPFHSQAGLWGAKAGYQKRFQPEPFTETALSCRLPSRRQNRRMDPIPRPGRRPTRRRERTRTNWIQGSPTAVFCRVPITSFRNLGKAGLHVWGKETQTIACKEGFGSSDGKNGV
jgi:hypothetical protein